MFPIFDTNESVLALVLAMVAAAFWLQKYKFFKTIGPALTVILAGILLVNLRIVSPAVPVLGSIQTWCVPISISLYLLNVDFGKIVRMSKQPLLAIGSACLCVTLVALLFGSVFAPRIDEGWKVAGMFVGTYTGGSSNLTAIATGLDASASTIAAANAADYVIGMPFLIFMFAAPAFMKKSEWFKKAWPYRFSEEELEEAGDGEELMATGEWSIKEIAALLAVSVAVVWIATEVSALFPADFASAGRILLISTFSIIAAQIPWVRKLRGAMNLGLFFGLMFLCVIGFAVDIRGFIGSALWITLFCFSVIIGSTVLHLAITRLLKIKAEYVLLGLVGAIADGTTAALVASGAKWKSLVGVGLLMGIIGSVLGNYLGIAVAYAVRATIGA